MPEMHLRQPRFPYSACGPFTKNKERIQRFKETRDTSYIYKNGLDKACFQDHMAYGDLKHLTKRAIADKVLKDKAFKIASNQKYDGYQGGLASMVYKFFDKKSQGSGCDSSSTSYRPSSSALQAANNDKKNIQLADELHKPIIRKFKKRNVYSSFRDNIWGVDLADMQLLSKFDKGCRFLNAWVIPLKDKKGISIANAFQKILDDSKRKLNKICVDKGNEFCNNSFKKWLQDNDIVMYSINNERKSAVAERFIRTFINT